MPRMTEAEAARLAEQIERDEIEFAPVDETDTPRRGRPSLSTEGVSPKVTLRLPEELLEQIRAAAEEASRGLSDQIREMLVTHPAVKKANEDIRQALKATRRTSNPYGRRVPADKVKRNPTRGR